MVKYDLKAILAKEAIMQVPATGVIGLGTGSTTNAFITALGKYAREHHLSYQVTASSYASEQLAIHSGLNLLKQNVPSQLNLVVDGADFLLEEKRLLIKGEGGALLREKILKQAAKNYLILITEDKLKRPSTLHVPLEILPFSLPFLLKKLDQFGTCKLRKNLSGSPLLSDNGNWLVDLFLPAQEQPSWYSLYHQLNSLAGVLETGLFPIEPAQPTTILVIDSARIVHKKIFQ
ncbi:ribose 5-phosphate isomerase A [Candidatus Similichlamydia laticola]|uniref:Ribose 5-phosphate isomerase A n=1 Tax=Candidatus Similichlamydia laticola TaxID=2170265 RepID=A0A369KAX7_9BACT|nr:ribose 5-phosphate isomerase A [Candidatus Similichlamydia laticola]RDB31761.1 Ribose 5-phosphate isomerase A [Candidatus Similichlamydia laticola]